ncbi:MAG: hypothetical protein K0R02_249 [Rickettsiaceae bacterium]|jgi:hypothetical protein|nr:hypothetical protein [Rickettsiaceae bacterium]
MKHKEYYNDNVFIKNNSILFLDEITDLQLDHLKTIINSYFRENKDPIKLEEVILLSVGQNIKKFLEENTSFTKNVKFFNINQNTNFQDAFEFCKSFKPDLIGINPKASKEELEMIVKDRASNKDAPIFYYMHNENVQAKHLSELGMINFTDDGAFLLLKAADHGKCIIENLLLDSDKLVLNETRSFDLIKKAAQDLKPNTWGVDFHNLFMTIYNDFEDPAKSLPIKRIAIQDIFRNDINSFQESLSFLDSLEVDQYYKNMQLVSNFREPLLNPNAINNPCLTIIPGILRVINALSNPIRSLDIIQNHKGLIREYSNDLDYVLSKITTEENPIREVKFINFNLYIPLLAQLADFIHAPNNKVQKITVSEYPVLPFAINILFNQLARENTTNDYLKTLAIKFKSLDSSTVFTEGLIKEIFAKPLILEKLALNVINNDGTYNINEQQILSILKNITSNQSQMKSFASIVSSLSDHGMSDLIKIAHLPEFKLLNLNITIKSSQNSVNNAQAENILYELLKADNTLLYFNNKPTVNYIKFKPIADFIKNHEYEIIDAPIKEKLHKFEEFKKYQDTVKFIMEKEDPYFYFDSIEENYVEQAYKVCKQSLIKSDISDLLGGINIAEDHPF